MSKQYHWVVVYDEHWGAFMVDAESEFDRDKIMYDKETGRWEWLDHESEEEAEYYRLEEILAYNLTRLDLTAERVQDTHMKTVRAYIAFDMSENDFIDDEPMTDEELMEYAKECFYDDINSFVKYNELWDVISTEIIND